MRILLADDQERVRYGLRALLRQQPGLHVVGEAENAHDLLALTTVLHPDLVLLDWHLPDVPGDKVLLSLRQVAPELPVIVLSGQIGIREAALEAGASAFFSKSSPPDRLLDAIRRVVSASTDGRCDT